jgi:DNA-directed RNA polymerase specialized sigma24 family protein
LRRLATARALDRLRRRIAENRRRSATPDWTRLASGDPGPNEQVGTRELAERTRQMLAKLPPRERR